MAPSFLCLFLDPHPVFTPELFFFDMAAKSAQRKNALCFERRRLSHSQPPARVPLYLAPGSAQDVHKRGQGEKHQAATQSVDDTPPNIILYCSPVCWVVK